MGLHAALWRCSAVQGSPPPSRGRSGTRAATAPSGGGACPSASAYPSRTPRSGRHAATAPLAAPAAHSAAGIAQLVPAPRSAVTWMARGGGIGDFGQAGTRACTSPALASMRRGPLGPEEQLRASRWASGAVGDRVGSCEPGHCKSTLSTLRHGRGEAESPRQRRRVRQRCCRRQGRLRHEGERGGSEPHCGSGEHRWRGEGARGAAEGAEGEHRWRSEGERCHHAAARAAVQ